MQLPETNFFSHFNKKKHNYSDEEIRFQLEVIGRAKCRRLTDGDSVTALASPEGSFQSLTYQKL